MSRVVLMQINICLMQISVNSWICTTVCRSDLGQPVPGLRTAVSHKGLSGSLIMPLPIVVMTSHSGGDIPPVDSVVVLRPAGSKSGWTVPIVLVLLTWAALGGVVFNGFVNYDDDLYLTANPSLTVGSAIDKLTWALTTTHSGNWHPLTWISHLIDVRIFGMNPAWHHAVSLALHTANALLLFALLRGLTGVIWPSALVAALFAIHPLHVESVAWAAERKDVLSTLFALAAALAFVRGVRQPGSGAWRVATPMFFALALLAKPMPISLPLLLLLDWWPLGRWSPADLGHPHARRARRARPRSVPPATMAHRGRVLVPDLAAAGDRTRSGRRASHGRPLHVPAAGRDLHRRCLGTS